MISLLLPIIYLAFISLGLPDSLLGSAWPVMHRELGVSVSSAGIISMIIAFGTVVSSLQSDRLTKKFGTGIVTAASVAVTMFALFGFSVSRSFAALILWAIPYGLGAGSVDASLNNYVALHYKSRHMSWLHCMWGVGASAGPYIMSWALVRGDGWRTGYRGIAFIQVALTAILLLSLPLWKKDRDSSARTDETDGANNVPLSLAEIVKLPGAVFVMLAFFCYSAVEQTTMLWAASFLVLHTGLASEAAAAFASLFFIGITAGRAASGFVTIKLNDTQMIRLGEAILTLGVALLFVGAVARDSPFGTAAALSGFALVGLGCAPIYPSIIHSTPAHFGADKSQAVIGVEMASAYVGTLAMPPLFGLLSRSMGIALLPFYLALFLSIMVFAHERLVRKAGNTSRPRSQKQEAKNRYD